MRLRSLQLGAFGHFTDAALNFVNGAGQRMTLVFGPNEAGKSTALRAISDLRFGIPHNSGDGFKHAYPDMRISGIFEDADGRHHQLVRHKRRVNSLQLASGEPACPQIETMLNGGLSRAEYESMFGLDHARLRAGGEALLKGEGDIGAALFEASAGTRSVPAILTQLDQSARRFFIPGARGRNAPINEALASLDEHQSTLRKSLVRPALWVERHTRHQQTLAALAQARAALTARQQRLMLIKELRAVAPLIDSLDFAVTVLAELAHTRLLSPDAAHERIAAESGLIHARHQAARALDQAQAARQRLSSLAPDAGVIQLAGAIDRLRAAAESIERLQADRDAAQRERDSWQRDAIRHTRGLLSQPQADDPQLALGLLPSPIDRARIDHALDAFEQSQAALLQHRDAVARAQSGASADAGAGTTPVPAGAVVLLRSALETARGLSATLTRLDALPADCAAADQQRDADIAALGIEASSLSAIRVMLDADIDAAIRLQGQHATRHAELRQRLAQVEEATATAKLKCDTLIAAGVSATPDDLTQARALRDNLWLTGRHRFVGRLDADSEAWAEAFALAQTRADRISDELSRDAERATLLQTSRLEAERLGGDAAKLGQALEDIVAQAARHQQRWSGQLTAHGLPELAPEGLREWQARLMAARASQDLSQRLRAEALEAQRITDQACAALSDAIRHTGLAQPKLGDSLRGLLSLATQIDTQIAQHEREQIKQAGAREQWRQQLEQMQARDKQLAESLAAAAASLSLLGGSIALSLPDTADAATASIVRARLGELATLNEVLTKADQAELALRRSVEAIEALHRQAHAIRQALGDPPFSDVRLYVDELARRLHDARNAEAGRGLAAQSLEQALADHAEHEAAAREKQAIIDALLHSAAVTDAALLPDAEERSRRRLAAQADVDRLHTQLASASRRSVDELRELLRAQDTLALQSEESDAEHDIGQLEQVLSAARAAEEAARRELDAIDSSDVYATSREAIESAAASVRTNMPTWLRTRLAHGLLAEALKRFRDRAQGPMLSAASVYFSRMTAGSFTRLISDEEGAGPLLLAQRADGTRIRVEALSEGTRDQLYLALRLAALDVRRREGVELPVILDDVLMTSDDQRASLMLAALSDFARRNQVILFTHHRHLMDVARAAIAEDQLAIVEMG